MSLPRLSASRPVAVAMVFLAIILVGTVSLARLPIDLLPDVSYPQLVIHAAEPGSSPAEVERALTEPIERAVASVPGVQRVSSVSREGVSLVTLRFAWGADMDFAALNVRERLDNMRGTLPFGAEAPVVLRTDPRSEPILSVSVSGPGDLRTLKELTEQVFKRRLEQLEGVAQAAVTGGLEREIHVEVDPQRLESHGVAIGDVAAALSAANAAGRGGTILQGRYRYALRTLGEFASAEEIGRVPIRLAGEGGADATILLSDLATVTDGVRDRESAARFVAAGEAQRGGESVGILVFKTSGQNTVQVAERVEETLVELRGEYPGVTLEVATSQAGFISDAISNVLQALLLGGVLAFLVLFLFLRDARYPVAIAVAIPIAVFGTFAFLDAAGISLNIMTLGGLALGVGLLVDNSIVVLENIFRLREMGVPMRRAAILGTEEVQGAITASTLTTISVFGPIVYVEGVAGELFGALSLAVAISLLVSLLVAVTLLPVMASAAGEPESGERMGWGRRLRLGVERRLARPLDAFDRAFARFAAEYEVLLRRALGQRRGVIGAAALLFGLTLVLAAFLPRGILPEVDEGSFQLQIEMPRGTPLETTLAVAERVESILTRDGQVAAVFTRVGRAPAASGLDLSDAGPHTASLDVRLADGAATAPAAHRTRVALAADAAEGSLLAAAEVGITTGSATALGQLLAAGEADLVVRVRGEEEAPALAYAAALETRLRGVEGLGSVRSGAEAGHPEVRLAIDRERAASYGIQPRQVVEAIDYAMRGTEATRLADFDRSVPIIVRLPEAARQALGTLDDVRVAGVPVSELVTLEMGAGPSEVHRLAQRRIVPVYADVTSGGLARALERAESEIADAPPPPGVTYEIGGGNEEMMRSFRGLGFALVLAMLLVYMILAAQFESLVHPFVILLSVPLALVGGIGALALTGSGLNTMSLIGIIVLAGIAVNDAIIKVDLINRLRRAGTPLRAAILEAGRARLRPIIMTTVTTIFGLAPMALGIGSGADLRAPLAIAVIGGLVTSTLLTLLVVPVVYEGIESLRSDEAPPRVGPLPALAPDERAGAGSSAGVMR